MSHSDDELGDLKQIVTGGFATVGRYGVIGHPITHSRSPDLHNAWFQAMRRPDTYELVDIPPGDLVRRGPSLPFEFAGLNVTIPHKVAILGYVDRVDEEAEAAGAANVLYRSRGDKAWCGSNTDGLGFARALEEATAEPIMGRDCVVLGAGGAARAIASTLVRKGAASVLIMNRTEENAREVCEAVGANGYGPLHPEILDMLSHAVDLVINTLPVAAEPFVGSMDLSPLGSHAVICDINYHLAQPSLLRRGDAAGLFTLDGMGMFLWQAALSFELWTGSLPDMELGRRILLGE